MSVPRKGPRNGNGNGNGNGHSDGQPLSGPDLAQLLVGGDIGKHRHDHAFEAGPAPRVAPAKLRTILRQPVRHGAPENA